MMADMKYILIDWGTSSFRLWAIDQGGTIAVSHHEARGMSSLGPAEYEPFLEGYLASKGIGAEVPVLICGMAGAKQGWQEAPYVDLPTKLDTLLLAAVSVVSATTRDIRILPGVAQRDARRPDVMRGEETILLGAILQGANLQDDANRLFCLPGTHSKWVSIQQNMITTITTMMTGELFALLKHHSTLSPLLDDDGTSLSAHPAFHDGVVAGADAPQDLPSLLFSIRSDALLNATDGKASLARLSGLLIGAELAAMRGYISGKVGLISQGALADLYKSAMSILALSFEDIDSHEMVLSGLIYCADQIWREGP